MNRENEEIAVYIKPGDDISMLNVKQLDSEKIIAIDEQLLAKADIQKAMSEAVFPRRLKYQGSCVVEKKRLYLYKIQERSGKWKVCVRRIVSGFLSLNIGRLFALIASYLALYEILIVALNFFGVRVEQNMIGAAIRLISLATGFLGMEVVAVHYKYGPFTGCWCYYVSPRTEAAAEHTGRVQTDLVRVVKIRIYRGALHLTGYQITAARCREHFYSDMTEIQYSTDDKSAGKLFYCFSDSTGGVVKGLCALDWRSTNGAIDQMNGWYAGQESKVIGQLNYRRISKKEFKMLTGGSC